MKIAFYICILSACYFNAYASSLNTTAVQSSEPCTVELHAREQVHERIKSSSTGLIDPLIEIVVSYISIPQKWQAGPVLDLNDKQPRAVHSMIALSPDKLAVSYMHEVVRAMTQPTPLSYSKLWDLTKISPTDFPVPAFIGGAAMAGGKVAVLLDSAAAMNVFDKTNNSLVSRVLHQHSTEHRYTAVVGRAESQIVGGLLNGDVCVSDVADRSIPPIHISSIQADIPPKSDFVPDNSVLSLCALSDQRVVVGKKKGHLRIVDLEAKTWGEELKTDCEPRTIVRKIVSWPNNKIAVLRGHEHAESHVQIWSVAGNGKFLRTMPHMHAQSIKDILALPDQIVAVARP